MAFVTLEDRVPNDLFHPGELDAFRRLSTLHADGWGYAIAPDETTAIDLYKSTQRAIDDEAFLTLTTSKSARAGLIHLRWASAGMEIEESNTHPFVNGEWAFAHNGSIPESERLLSLLDVKHQTLRSGTTDSELYFLLVLQEIDNASDASEGVRRAVARIRKVAPVASLNALLLGPDVLIVVHSHDGMDNPIGPLIAACGGEESFPPLHAERYFDLQWRRDSNSVVVAHAGLPGPGWEELPQNSTLVVNRHTLASNIGHLNDSKAVVASSS